MRNLLSMFLKSNTCGNASIGIILLPIKFVFPLAEGNDFFI